MIRIYLKQAWALIREERLFSAIYIVGTGLAITLVMVLSIVFYVKVAPVYPELNRERTLSLRFGAVEHEGKGMNSGPISRRLVSECVEGTEGLEAVALTRDLTKSAFVQPDGSSVQLPATRMAVDGAFWRVFSFRFVEGKPFGEAEARAGMPVAVIARSLARRLFGDAEAVGRTISVDFEPFRVVGVVADASFLLEEVYAQIWYPYMYDVDERRERLADSNNPGLGAYRCYALVERGASVGDTRERIRERLDRFGRSLGDGMTFTSLGGPDRHWESLFRYWSNQAPDVSGELFRYGMVFFFLLLVPAVSLSGLADSRMERRLAEMGARRAFGAPRSALMGQVLTENLLYTLLGGALGLLFSFAVAYGAREWIFKIGKGFTAGPMAGVEQSFPLDGLLNPWVFLIALAVCFVLNLMSTLWPAWRAARRPIVESLNA